MNSTLRTRGRHALVATLAGAALTAGLGLGGAGVADAAPNATTCLSDLTTTTTITDHGKSVTLKPVPQAVNYCLSSGQGSRTINYTNTPAVIDPTGDGWDVSRSQPQLVISDLDPASGTVRVTLNGSIEREGRAYYGKVIAKNNVFGKVGPGRMTLRDVVTDNHGRTADTTVSFTVFAI